MPETDAERPFFLLDKDNMAKLYGVSKVMIGRWMTAGLIPPGHELHGKRYWEGYELAEFEKRPIRAHYNKERTDVPSWERWSFEFEEPPEPRQKVFPRPRKERRDDEYKDKTQDEEPDALLNITGLSLLYGVMEPVVRDWIKAGRIPEGRGIPGLKGERWMLSELEAMEGVRAKSKDWEGRTIYRFTKYWRRE